jgi:hypothetical protein
MNIDELVQAHRGDDVDSQPIKWNRSMWEKVWSDENVPGREALDLIDAEVKRSATIRRSWLQGLADDDPITFLVATAIWGYGNFGRGVKALGAMLRRDGVAGIVSDVIQASRQGPAPGFRALFDSGRPRIPWLGIAYGTKVVHFAGYQHADPAPLILDKRVFLGAKALGTDRVPDPGKYMTGDEYADYCAWAAAVAHRNDVSSQLVEYVLFLYGGDLRQSHAAETRRSDPAIPEGRLRFTPPPGRSPLREAET